MTAEIAEPGGGTGPIDLGAAPNGEGAVHTVDALLGEIVDQALALLQADTAALLPADASARVLVAAAARGIAGEVQQGVQIPVTSALNFTVTPESAMFLQVCPCGHALPPVRQ